MDIVGLVQYKKTLYHRLYCNFMKKRHHIKDCRDCVCSSAPIHELTSHEFVVTCPY